MMIDVLLPGDSHITQMDEASLLRLEGGFENDDERVEWVQYHLVTTGELVHRSAAVHVKRMPGIGAIVDPG